jgi:hypothetical protein
MKIKQLLREGYVAYVLGDPSRNLLAKRFPPKYPEFVGHHITVEFGVPKDASLPFGDTADIEVVGYTEDDGIEALVVAVNGETKRPDGKTYHITWSLDRSKGRKPVDSNNVVAQRGFTKVSPIVVYAILQYLD